MCRVAILAEDGEKIALGEIEGEAADVDVGGVAVVGMPGGGGGDGDFEFAFVEGLGLADGVHRRMKRGGFQEREVRLLCRILQFL